MSNSEDYKDTPLSIEVGRRDIPSCLHGDCLKCIKHARDKYNNFMSDSGTFYEDGFAVECSFIPPNENFVDKKLKDHMTKEDWETVNAYRSALLWGEKYLVDPDNGRPWKAWSYQRGPLLCNSPRAVYRFGRRTGKTTILAVKILWYLFTAGGGRMKDPETGKIRNNLKVLLLAPQKSHVENIFDRIRAFLAATPSLSSCIDRNKRGSPQMITLASESGIGGGSALTGFASGDSSGSKGLSARGQDADLIILDEGAFISAQAIEGVVLAILYTRPSTHFIISSTPSGIANDYFETVCTKRPDFAEFYVPATERPDWSIMEKQMKREYGSSQEQYDKEVLAAFSPAGIGVYREDLVRFAQSDYEYGDLTPNAGMVYTFGVDWNKEHGTEIAIIATQKGLPHVSYVVHSENIPKKENTSPRGISRIVELNKIWKPLWIYVDAGGGDGGAMLRFHGRKMVGKDILDATLKDIVKDFDFGSKIEVAEHDGIRKKVPSKPFMVENSVKKFELGELKFPRSDLNILRQLNNYIVIRRTPAGIPVYGTKEKKFGDHTLDAINLALVAVRIELPSFHNPEIGPMGTPVAFVPNAQTQEEPLNRVILPAVAARPQDVVQRNVGISQVTHGSVIKYWGREPSEKEVSQNRTSKISRRHRRFGR
jgi:hypothetical protein